MTRTRAVLLTVLLAALSLAGTAAATGLADGTPTMHVAAAARASVPPVDRAALVPVTRPVDVLRALKREERRPLASRPLLVLAALGAALAAVRSRLGRTVDLGRPTRLRSGTVRLRAPPTSLLLAATR
jgi:hypothetical protein